MIDDAYTDEDRASELSDRLMRRLGKAMPVTSELHDELLGDLNPEVGGIGWWAPTVPIRSRIRIGDFVYAVVAAMPAAMAEALVACDLLEKTLNEDTDRWRDHIEHVREPSVPPARSPTDDVRAVTENICIGAVLTALSRLLDHVAAALIAIFDLPSDLRRADWGWRLLKHLDDVGRRDWLNELVESSGPPGWMRWFTSIRNAKTHRPAQLSLRQTRVYVPGLVMPPASDLDRFRIISHLPRCPELSYVESVLQAGSPSDQYLTENAVVTMRRLCDAMLRLAERFAADAACHWRDRRVAAQAQDHYAEQWPLLDEAPFEGFAPNSEPFDIDFMLLGDRDVHRLRAAHLFDQARAVTWSVTE